MKIPRTTLEKIGQEETVWLCLSLTEKRKEGFGGWSSHEVEH